jgi:hypothetical protein
VRNIPPLLALVAIVMAGCLTDRGYWHNPAKTLKEARLDCQECYDEAVMEALDSLDYDDIRFGTPDFPCGPTYNDPWGNSEFVIHLEWTNWWKIQKKNIFRGCMKHNGYHRIEADRLSSAVRKQNLLTGKVAGR